MSIMPYIKQDNSKPDKDILEKYNTFRLAHQYDSVAKIWRFKGYTCIKCDRTVQNPNIVPKHYSNCKKKEVRPYDCEPEAELILDVYGKEWRPYETNQKKPLINTE